MQPAITRVRDMQVFVRDIHTCLPLKVMYRHVSPVAHTCMSHTHSCMSHTNTCMSRTHTCMSLLY